MKKVYWKKVNVAKSIKKMRMNNNINNNNNNNRRNNNNINNRRNNNNNNNYNIFNDYNLLHLN